MNESQYILNKIAEEASEVSKAALKAAEFGLDDVYPVESGTTFERLVYELNDLLATVEMLGDHHPTKSYSFVPNQRQIAEKKLQVRRWMEYSRGVGQLTPESTVLREQLEHLSRVKGEKDEKLIEAYSEIEALKRQLAQAQSQQPAKRVSIPRNKRKKTKAH